MGEILVRSSRGVTLVGGGPVDDRDLDAALGHAPDLVAADGGGDAVLARGRMPLAVIGDIDSLSPAAAARLPPERIHRIEEQDSTDFQKCLRRIHAPLVLGVGFLGARLDHALAACHALSLHPHPCILVGRDDVAFHAMRAVDLDLAPGTRVSLFPMRRVTARSRGLLWPLDGLDLSPGTRIGTSNAATGPVRIEPGGGGLLVLLPRDALEAAVRALLADGEG